MVMAAREQMPVLSLWAPATTLRAEMVVVPKRAGVIGEREKLPRAVQQGFLVHIQT